MGSIFLDCMYRRYDGGEFLFHSECFFPGLMIYYYYLYEYIFIVCTRALFPKPRPSVIRLIGAFSPMDSCSSLSHPSWCDLSLLSSLPLQPVLPFLPELKSWIFSSRRHLLSHAAPLYLLICCTQEHFLEVVGGQEFQLLPLEEMERLLTSDDINVPDEETVVTSLLTWVHHDTSTRQQHLPSLLAHIRLPLLQPQVGAVFFIITCHMS